MINKIQQSINNNYKPAFGDSLVFEHRQRKIFTKAFKACVEKSDLKNVGVAPFYRTKDKSFDVDKLINKVQSLFKLETPQSHKTYLAQSEYLSDGGVPVITIKQKESGDSFILNCTHLLKPYVAPPSKFPNNRFKTKFAPGEPDVTQLVKDMQFASESKENKKEIAEKYLMPFGS